MKALCPLLNLGAQLAVWVCPFLERRGQRDLVNGTWGVGWVGSTEGWRTAGCEGPGICVTGTVVAAFVCVKQRSREVSGPPPVGHMGTDPPLSE